MDVLQHDVLTNTDSVTVISKNLLNTQVADDDVLLLLDQTILVLVSSRIDVWNDNIQAETAQDSLRVLADNASVASNTNLLGRLGDGAVHNDNLGLIAGDGGSEGSVRRDGGSSATSTTIGTSVLTGITSSDLIQSDIRMLFRSFLDESRIDTHIIDVAALSQIGCCSRSSQCEAGQAAKQRNCHQVERSHCE